MGPRGVIRRGRRPAGPSLGGFPPVVGRDDRHVPVLPGCEVVTGSWPERSDLERLLWRALADVHDPEIPPCSITDLGIVERVAVAGDHVEIDLLPTFSGCPALDVILQDAEAAARR